MRLSEAIRPAIDPQITANLSEAIKTLYSRVNSYYSPEYIRNMENMRSIYTEYAKIFKNYADIHNYTNPIISDALSSKISKYIEVYHDALEPDQIAVCEEEILPTLEKPEKRLPKGTILSIISILITIFFGIIACMPDKQLDEVIQNQEILIAQNEKIIELEEIISENEEADILLELSDTIQQLSDQLEQLPDYTE